MKENSCIVCGADSRAGLNILGSMICPSCERRIMTTDASDAQYNTFVQKLLSVAQKTVRT